MLETQTQTPKPETLVSNFEIDVEPEKATEVGQIFQRILEQYGEPGLIMAVGRQGVRRMPGLVAEFSGNAKSLVVKKRDDQEKIQAILTLPDSKDIPGGAKDIITYLSENNTLIYDSGIYPLFSISEQPLKENEPSVVRMGKFGQVPVSAHPPNQETLHTVLDRFLYESELIVENRKTVTDRARGIGRKALGRLLR